jgi:hypothetical protein
LWVMTQCRYGGEYQQFQGTCYLHLTVYMVSQPRLSEPERQRQIFQN